MTQEEIRKKKEEADRKFAGRQKTMYAVCPATKEYENASVGNPCPECDTTIINSLDCDYVCRDCDNDCSQTECLIKGGKV